MFYLNKWICLCWIYVFKNRIKTVWARTRIRLNFSKQLWGLNLTWTWTGLTQSDRPGPSYKLLGFIRFILLNLTDLTWKKWKNTTTKKLNIILKHWADLILDQCSSVQISLGQLHQEWGSIQSPDQSAGFWSTNRCCFISVSSGSEFPVKTQEDRERSWERSWGGAFRCSSVFLPCLQETFKDIKHLFFCSQLIWDQLLHHNLISSLIK